MAKKAHHEEEQQGEDLMEQGQEGKGFRKSQAVRDLLEEWTRDGKDTKSNTALMQELEKRHPGVKWTVGDVAQNKSKWLKSKAVPGARKEAPAPRAAASPRPGAAPAAAAAADSQGEESPFVQQLRQAVSLLGKDAIKKLIDTI
jgi:hypothetical protein